MSIKKFFTLMAVAIISFTVFLPQLAQAYTTVGDKDNASLTIYKYEQEGTPGGAPGTGDDGQTVPGNATALPGVEFTITQTHSFDPATNEWAEKAGTPFKETTDAKGKIKVENIELGRYSVVESAGPDHVVLNPDTFHVDIPMSSVKKDKTQQLNYDVVIYPKNETIKGAVELTKKGEKGEALAEAEFELYKGTHPNGEQIGGTYTTDANGKIVANGLDFGDYYFVETKAPAGHALDTRPIVFSITETGAVNQEDGTIQGTVVERAMDNYIIPKIEKDVEGQDHLNIDRDKEYKYNLKLTLPANIEDYEEFVVTDILDDRLSFISDGTITDGWTVTGIDSSLIDFVKNDQTLTWSINDFEGLEGASEFTITFTAKINPDAELTPEETGIPNEAQLDFDNSHGTHTKPKPGDPEIPPIDPPTTPPVTVEPTDGGMKIVKVDAADNNIKLEGAVFDLKNADGSDVVIPEGSLIKVNGVSVDSLNDLETPENGLLEITGLPIGDYILIETKAPTYTDEDGKEQSYRLLTSPEEITIVGDGSDDKEILVENSKSGWELPETGGMGTILFTLVGLGLMAMAAFFLTRRKKEVEA